MVASQSTTVKVKDLLPSNSLTTISCAASPRKTLKSGDEYSFVVTNTSQVYNCGGMWGLKFTSFHGFEPNTDVGHPNVFWQLREDGIYHSLDNSKFVKSADWETE
ncbi:hypothetical protein ACFE04_013951 [Oxalis oulophora]